MTYNIGPNGEKTIDPLRARVAAQIKAAKEAADKKLKSSLGKPLVLAGATPEGKSFSSEKYKGKVVLVDFWATWCMPCLAELPRIREAYGKYHDKGLEVIGVSSDFEVDALTKYVAENNMPWVQILDKPDTRTQLTLTSGFGIRAIPAIFLIDKKGVCRSVTGSENMDELIPKLLAE